LYFVYIGELYPPPPFSKYFLWRHSFLTRTKIFGCHSQNHSVASTKSGSSTKTIWLPQPKPFGCFNQNHFVASTKTSWFLQTKPFGCRNPKNLVKYTLYSESTSLQQPSSFHHVNFVNVVFRNAFH